jgi:hypothetical protein
MRAFGSPRSGLPTQSRRMYAFAFSVLRQNRTISVLPDTEEDLLKA